MSDKKSILTLYRQIQKKLKTLSDRNLRLKLKKEIGPGARIYGVTPTDLRKIARQFSSRFKKNDDMEGAYYLSEKLIKSKVFEETYIGIEILSGFSRRFDMHAFWGLERLVDYMNCARNTDLMCAKLLGPILEKYPHDATYLGHWANSSNKWRRRVSAVVLLGPLKKGKDVNMAFKIAKRLCGEKNRDVLEAFGKLMLVLAGVDGRRTAAFIEEFERRIPEDILINISARLKRKKKR